jgi:hypothetical protein
MSEPMAVKTAHAGFVGKAAWLCPNDRDGKVHGT